MSAAALVLSIYIPKRSAKSASRSGARATDFGMFRDLAIAYGIMTAVALLFAGLDVYLQSLASPLAAETTITRLLELQRHVDGAFAFLKNYHVFLMTGGLVLLCGLVLLVLGETSAFDTLFATRKRAGKIAKAGTIAALSFGSFALAGTASAIGAQTHTDTYYFRQEADAKRDVAMLRKAVRQELAIRIADAVVLHSLPKQLPACPGDQTTTSQTCPASTVADTAGEIARARAISESWPNRPDRYGLPRPPSAAASFSAALAEDAAIDALQTTLKRAGEPPPPHSSDHLSARALHAAAVVVAPPDGPEPGPEAPIAAAAAADAATAAAAAADASTTAAAAAADASAPDRPSAPSASSSVDSAKSDRSRLRDLIALAVSMAPEMANFEIAPGLDKMAGGFAVKLFDALKGSVQSKLEDTVTDVVTDVVAGCTSAPEACSQRLQERMRAAENDPRVVGMIDKLSSVVAASRDSLIGPGLALHKADDAADREIKVALRPMEAADRDREWSQLLQRWRERLEAKSDGLGPGQRARWVKFLEDWDASRDDYARKMMAANKAGTQEDWNLAFLDYTKNNPQEAAIYGYMILNDPEIRHYLVAEQPSVKGKEVGVAGAYLLFVSTVRGKPWSDRESLPEAVVASSREFDRGIDNYCPHKASY